MSDTYIKIVFFLIQIYIDSATSKTLTRLSEIDCLIQYRIECNLVNIKKYTVMVRTFCKTETTDFYYSLVAVAIYSFSLLKSLIFKGSFKLEIQ